MMTEEEEKSSCLFPRSKSSGLDRCYPQSDVEDKSQEAVPLQVGGQDLQVVQALMEAFEGLACECAKVSPPADVLPAVQDTLACVQVRACF